MPLIDASSALMGPLFSRGALASVIARCDEDLCKQIRQVSDDMIVDSPHAEMHR